MSCGIPVRAVLLLLLAAGPAAAVELHIQFGALERMLAEQIFTQQGRRYVRGSKADKCNFAYLENPRIQEQAGRLRIRARFTGRAALNVLGQCVGLGDDFYVVIVARPRYQGGNVELADVTAASDGKTGYYIRMVLAALQSSLAKDFRYPVREAARQVMEDPAAQPGYRRELRDFAVPEIRVTADALVLVLDFVLLVK